MDDRYYHRYLGHHPLFVLLLHVNNQAYIGNLSASQHLYE